MLVGDLCHRQTLADAVRSAKVVYHCATAKSSAGDDEVRRTNLDGVRDLLHAASATRCRRVILLSSLNVSLASRGEQLSEETFMPRTGDVRSDVSIDVEALGLQFSQNGDVDVTVVRPGLVYGPGDRQLPSLAAALRHGEFAFQGTQQNVVPLVFISELVQFMIRVVQVPAAQGRVYNVTDGSCTTVYQLVTSLARIMGYPLPRVVTSPFLPRVAWNLFGWAGRRRSQQPGLQGTLKASRRVSIERARREVGFQPRTPRVQQQK